MTEDSSSDFSCTTVTRWVSSWPLILGSEDPLGPSLRFGPLWDTWPGQLNEPTASQIKQKNHQSASCERRTPCPCLNLNASLALANVIYEAANPVEICKTCGSDPTVGLEMSPRNWGSRMEWVFTLNTSLTHNACATYRMKICRKATKKALKKWQWKFMSRMNR